MDQTGLFLELITSYQSKMAASAPKTLGKAKSSIVNRHLVRDLDFTNIAQKVIDLVIKLAL